MIINKFFNTTLGIITTITGLSAWSVGCDDGDITYGPPGGWSVASCCHSSYRGDYDQLAFEECMRSEQPEKHPLNCDYIDHETIKNNYQKRLDACCGHIDKEDEAYTECENAYLRDNSCPNE